MASAALTAANFSDDEFELVPRPSVDCDSHDGQDFEILSITDSGILSADSDSDSRPESPSRAASAVIEALEDLRCDRLPNVLVTDVIARLHARQQEAAVLPLATAVPTSTPEVPSASQTPLETDDAKSTSTFSTPAVISTAVTSTQAAATHASSRRTALLLLLMSAYGVAVVTLILLGTGFLPASPNKGHYWPEKTNMHTPFSMLDITNPSYAPVRIPKLSTYIYNATNARRDELARGSGHLRLQPSHSCSVAAATCSTRLVEVCSKDTNGLTRAAVAEGSAGLKAARRAVDATAVAAHPVVAAVNPLLACPVCLGTVSAFETTGANSSVSVELVKPQKPFAELFLHPLKVFATPTSMPLVCKARAASTASSATLVPSAAAAVNAGPQVAAAAAGALYDAGPAAPRWNPLLACGVCRHVLVKKPTPANSASPVSSTPKQLTVAVDLQHKHLAATCPAPAPAAAAAAAANATVPASAAAVLPTAAAAPQQQQQSNGTMLTSLLWQIISQAAAAAAAGGGGGSVEVATTSAPVQAHRSHSNSTLGPYWLSQFLGLHKKCQPPLLQRPLQQQQQQQSELWQMLQPKAALSSGSQVARSYRSWSPQSQKLPHSKTQQQQQQQQQRAFDSGNTVISGYYGGANRQSYSVTASPKHSAPNATTGGDLSNPGGVAAAAAAAVAAVFRHITQPVKPVPPLYVPAPPCLLITPEKVAASKRPVQESNLRPQACKARDQRGFGFLDHVQVPSSNPRVGAFFAASQLSRSLLMLEDKAVSWGSSLTLPMLPAAVIAPPGPPAIQPPPAPAAAAAIVAAQPSAAAAASALTLSRLLPTAFASPPPAITPAAAPKRQSTAAAAAGYYGFKPSAAAAEARLTLPMLPPVCPALGRQQQQWHKGSSACFSSSSSSVGGGLTLPMLPPTLRSSCTNELQQLAKHCSSSRQDLMNSVRASSQIQIAAAAWPAEQQQQQQRLSIQSSSIMRNAVRAFEVPDWAVAALTAATSDDHNITTTNSSSSNRSSSSSIGSGSSDSSSSREWVTTWASFPMLPPQGPVAAADGAASLDSSSSSGTSPDPRASASQVHSAARSALLQSTQPCTKHVTYDIPTSYVSKINERASRMQQPLNDLLQHLDIARARSLQCKLPVSSITAAVSGKARGFRHGSSSSSNDWPAFMAIDAAAAAASTLLSSTKQLQAAVRRAIRTSHHEEFSWESSYSSSGPSSLREVQEMCQAVAHSHREVQAKLAAAVYSTQNVIRSIGSPSVAKDLSPLAAAARAKDQTQYISVASSLCDHSVHGKLTAHQQVSYTAIQQHGSNQQSAIPAAAAAEVPAPARGPLVPLKKPSVASLDVPNPLVAAAAPIHGAAAASQGAAAAAASRAAAAASRGAAAAAASRGAAAAPAAASRRAAGTDVKLLQQWLLNPGWDQVSAAAAARAAAEVAKAEGNLQKACQHWAAANSATTAAAAEYGKTKYGPSVVAESDGPKGAQGYDNLGHARVLDRNQSVRMIRAYTL